MILDAVLGSKVTVKALRAMLRQPYKQWFFKELVRDLGVGVGPLRKALKEIVAQGVAQERIVGKQHFYKPDLESRLTRSLFDLFTIERTLEIPVKLRTALEEVVARLKVEAKDDLLSVVVFGSVAMGRAKPESDLDLLLIFDHSPKDAKEIRTQLDSVSGFYDTLVQEHIMARNEFLEMYGYGDDLVANALAEGIVLYDTGFLVPLLSKPLPVPSSRVAMRNLEEARRKIEDAKRNYRAGSLGTTIELLRLADSFAARGYLILKGELPGSRHSLVSQMRKYSAEFAALLDNVTKMAHRTTHAETSVDKERVWNMLRECEGFVRQSLEESTRVS